MKTFIRVLLILIFAVQILFAQENSFNGKWKLIKSMSADWDYFGYVNLEFSVGKNELTLSTQMGPKRSFEEKMILKTDGKFQNIIIKDGTFATNLYMAFKLPVQETKRVSANWENNNILKITEQFEVLSSQGSKRIEVNYVYELSPDKDLITCKISRESRKSGPEMKFIFKKYDKDNAYVMKLADDWDINSKLPEQACLISLQGVVNENKPNLYFLFGPDYPFNYTEDLYNYIEKQKNFSFTRLSSLDQAITVFKDYIKGYIVWDKNVRTSLIVAYTLAGLEKGIVISEDLIPLAKRHRLKEIEDFRGRFTGKTDFEIYSWAKEKYWSRCSREVICWLGGVHGTELMPSVADYGMMKKAFFSDLSSRSTDTLEYNLTKSLLSEMKPLSQVLGWHSYKKDFEEEWVTLTSSYALTVDGLNSLPNASFLVGIPATPGFKLKNHHNIVPGKIYKPEKKIYIALVQTDGLGLGAWVKPGRGSIPFAWEFPAKFKYMMPVMLELYSAQATPNDYFIGALSGSSYMYPKAFPKKWLPKEIESARKLMEEFDLNVFEIMDYAGDKTEAGENNLPKDIVDEYYKDMPDAIGFLNGYFASNTYTVRDKKPFLSYDYYLSAEKPEEEAAADLRELAYVNSQRPYFLVAHVRESSDVARVKSICDKLGKDFEIVPLDILIKMAGENPTFKEQFLK
jgi:hypothetical protein